MKTKFLQRVLWMVVPLLTMFSTNVWAETDTQSYDGADLAGWSGSHSGQYADESLKLDATGENAYKYDIWSGTVSSNMTSLSITINYKMNGSGTMTSNVFTIAAVNKDGVVKASTTFCPNATSYTDKTVTLTIPASSAVTGLKIEYTTKGNRNVGVASLSATATYTAVTYNVYLMSGCTGGSYSSNEGTSGSGAGIYSSCTKYSGISASTSVTITATPSSGYQFDGWTDGGYSIIFDDSSNEITPSSTTSSTATFTMPSSDVVIWECNFSETCANTMTINKGTATNCTFSLGTSGSGIASCSGVSTTVTVTPNTGYGTPSVTQSGASKTPTITGSGTSWTVSYPANTTSTSTINVSCSANNYTITLNTDLTPTSAGTTSITATYNASTNLTSAITKPTKTGWTFGGYYTAKNGGGTQIIGADGNVIASASDATYTYTDASRNWKYAGNITLYAKWTCTVTWSVNGSTSVYSTQTVTYNSSGSKVASIPGPPSPASYCGDKFVGWSAKSAGSESKTTSYYDDLFTTVGGSPDIKSIGDITFYAVFADYDD